MPSLERTTVFAGSTDRTVRLAELAALECGWEGHGRGQPMAASSLATAARVLNLLALNSSPMPGVFPNPDGFVQLEWSTPTMYRVWECLADGTIVHLSGGL